MKLWTKVLTTVLVSAVFSRIAFVYSFDLSGRYCLVFLCILILTCTFVILGRIKALESKIEALAGERNKPETGETESEGNR